MAGRAQQTVWTWDTYLAWEVQQPVRYELVDGQVHPMGDGTAEHDTIANNLWADLRARLLGSPCRVHGPDLKVRAGRDGRYPAAIIDCGERVPGAVVAQEPRAVFEVLSRSTAWIDRGLKLRDYDATASIQYYVLVSQDEPRAMVYTRDGNGRLGIQNAGLLEGVDASVDLPDFGFSIPFSALYEGTDLLRG